MSYQPPIKKPLDRKRGTKKSREKGSNFVAETHRALNRIIATGPRPKTEQEKNLERWQRRIRKHG